MHIGEKLYMALFGLTLCSMTMAQVANPTTDLAQSSLTKNTKVIAKADSTNEFYVIAENDEPKLKSILIEGSTAVRDEPSIATNTHGANTYVAKTHVAITQKHVVSRAHTKGPVKLKRSFSANNVIKAKQHVPSKMELALNNALEKAIRKKQFASKLNTHKKPNKLNHRALQAKLSSKKMHQKKEN